MFATEMFKINVKNTTAVSRRDLSAIFLVLVYTTCTGINGLAADFTGRVFISLERSEKKKVSSTVAKSPTAKPTGLGRIIARTFRKSISLWVK